MSLLCGVIIVPMQVLHQTDHNKPAWDQLAWGVRTGGQPFEETHGGLSQFAWLKMKPAEEQKFSKAMTEIDSMGGALRMTQACSRLAGPDQRNVRLLISSKMHEGGDAQLLDLPNGCALAYVLW